MSWQGYALLYPPAVLLMIVTVPEFFAPGQWPAGIAVATVAYGAVGVVLALASVTVLRHRDSRPAPVWVTAMVGGLAWMARSAMLTWYLVIVGPEADALVGQRLLTGFLLGVTIVPGVAWLLSGLDDFRSARAALVDERVRQELSAQHSVTYLEVMRADLLERVTMQVRSSVAAAAEVARAGSNAGEPGQEESVAALERAMRRASHEMASEIRAQALADSRVRASVVIEVVSRHPYSYWSIPGYLVVEFLVLARFVHPGVAALLTLLSGTWALLVTWAGNALCARVRKGSVIAFLLTIPVVIAGGFVISGLTFAWGLTPDMSVQLALTIGWTLAFTMVGGGVADSINVAESRVLADTASTIHAAEVKARALAVEEARVRREIATHLHGTVGANLTAAVMRLRQAMDAGDLASAQQAYEDARWQLELDMQHSLTAGSNDLGELLSGLADSWAGIAEISVVVKGADALGSSRARSVMDVVTEAVNNAIRHGDAQHIEVRVMGGDESVSITVVNDGEPVAVGQRGLGSSLYDQVARDAWTLESNDGAGSTLYLRMSLT